MPVVDLFCGCGGLSRGFEDAGFEIVAAFDGWESAVNCYNANFHHQAHLLDLSNVDAAVHEIEAYNPTVIIGGPPCQEFSNAGRRQEGNRADLTVSYANIITQLMPDYFVMENVPRVRNSRAYATAKEIYKTNGYGLTEVILDASRCGVPQKRNRFFCIGAHHAEDNFLLETIFNNYFINEPISVQDYFANNNIPLNITSYYRHPTTYQRRAIFGVNEVAPTIRGVNRPRPGTYQIHENDVVPDEGINQVHSLTMRERATIQTFPQNYNFDNLGISMGDLEQMVGNAVPVGLAHFVGTCLHDYMELGQEGNANMDNRERFAQWLREIKHYSDRSISDVFSRLRRAETILPGRECDKYFITDLDDNQEFRNLNITVQSQIRNAIRLKISFLETQNNE